jgi:hypothetical protein
MTWRNLSIHRPQSMSVYFLSNRNSLVTKSARTCSGCRLPIVRCSCRHFQDLIKLEHPQFMKFFRIGEFFGPRSYTPMNALTSEKNWRSRWQKFSTNWKRSFLKRRIRLEDFWRPNIIPCISLTEYFQTFQTNAETWYRLKAEFETEICVANQVDPQVLYSFVERIRPERFFGNWHLARRHGGDRKNNFAGNRSHHDQSSGSQAGE